MKNEKIIARGFGFEVYYRANRYYLNTFKDIIHSYSTIDGITRPFTMAGTFPQRI